MTSSPRRNIVVISSNDDSHMPDTHIPLVQAHLDRPLILIDPVAAAEGSGLGVLFEAGSGQTSTLLHTKNIGHVDAVWYRKPRPIELLELPLAGEAKDFSEYMLRSFVAAFRSEYQDAFWISDYYNILRASNKPHQLRMAAKLGFNVPDTIFTSSPQAAKTFVDQHDEVIVKSMELRVYRENGKSMGFFAQKLNKQTVDYKGLSYAPSIFQQAIDLATDIRVNVVGDKVFPLALTGSALQNPSTVTRDWRIIHFRGDAKAEPFDLPAKIKRLCVAHVKAMGLEFGALDLLLDKKGKFWFLENNPNGQWGFAEIYGGQPIGKAIAEHLMTGGRKSAKRG